ncbi:MAG: hypothetical protein ACRD47_04235 [Nitrososphaeraceae archaeon]
MTRGLSNIEMNKNLSLLLLLTAVLGMVVSSAAASVSSTPNIAVASTNESNDGDDGNGNGDDEGSEPVDDSGGDDSGGNGNGGDENGDGGAAPIDGAAVPPNAPAAPAVSTTPEDEIPSCDNDEFLNENNECEKIQVQPPVCGFDEFVNDDNECEKIPQDPVTAVLPPCDGSFQDCVTPEGNVCLAGASTHECELPNPGDELSPYTPPPGCEDLTPLECLGEMIETPPPECELTPLECLEDLLNDPIPSPIPPVEPEPEPEPPVFNPDESCMFDPSQPKCIPPEGEDCPEGFGTNEDGQCFFRHDQGCPDGYHSHEDDESGKCIPDDVPCEPGYVRDPDYPTCNDKERVCEEHPNADVCKDDDDERHKVIIKKINIHKTIHNTADFPDVDIIGLSIKDTGDAMVCMMNIDNDWVQCQEFGVPNERINENIWRIIETDSDKDYDNANTGSDDVDDAINGIKGQDFSELDDIDNHDFNVDLAALAISLQGDGLICLIEDDRNEGTGLCEPFKISETAVSGQITEITEFE